MIEISRDYATCDLKSPEGRGEKDEIGEELRFFAARPRADLRSRPRVRKRAEARDGDESGRAGLSRASTSSQNIRRKPSNFFEGGMRLETIVDRRLGSLAMEEKETVPCFILKLPLRVDSAGWRVFARDFLYALQLRNATLGTVLRRDRKMKQSDEWKEICRLPQRT